jgi:tripartite-type tricarboxylate transporter receptor subunit TctC
VEDYVGVVRADSPYKTLKDLVEAARKKPNGIRIGGSSVGSSDSIIENRLEKAAGIQLNYIVFQSGGEVNAALLGGSVDLATPNPSEAAQLMTAGRLRGIAMFSPERLQKWPNVPTAREQGRGRHARTVRGVIAAGGSHKGPVSLLAKRDGESVPVRGFQEIHERRTACVRTWKSATTPRSTSPNRASSTHRS